MHSAEADMRYQEGRIRGLVVNFGDFLSTLCTQLSGVALSIIVAICTINVIGRYAFGHAFSWAEEAMVYCMIFIIFFASAAVTWKGRHLSLDMVLRKLPIPAQKAIVYGGTLASVGLLLVLASTSGEVVAKLYRFAQRSDALEIPMWIPQSFVPAGLSLIALMMLLRLLTHDPVPQGIDFTAEDQEL